MADRQTSKLENPGLCHHCQPKRNLPVPAPSKFARPRVLTLGNANDIALLF